ncbi:MAG: hypothetical protein JNM10_20180 [Planctomycetia bacterium]|nr:hypothetical protein [Planctomycetia bacterium]
MKVALPDSGPPVATPAPLAWAIVLDLVVALGFVAVGVVAATRGTFEAAWAPWALVAYGVALVVADLAAARMRPTGLTWRRRLGYLALGALAWRGGPFRSEDPRVVALVVLWVGALWIALVLGGRALSRAIAGATGEDRPE